MGTTDWDGQKIVHIIEKTRKDLISVDYLREVAPENQPSMLRWGQRIFAKFAPDVDIGPKTRHEKFF